MNITMLCNLINKTYIISEHLRDVELLPYMDIVIDDINTRLQANFPTFSDWLNYTTIYNDAHRSEEGFVPLDPQVYTAIPARYLRSVVAIGAALNFFTNDEEGEQIATKYYVQYEQNMFTMIRDFHELVPVEFRNELGGFVRNTYNAEENVPACTEGIVMTNGEYSDFL